MALRAIRFIMKKSTYLQTTSRCFHESRFLVSLDESNKYDVSKLLQKLKRLPTEKHPNSYRIKDSRVVQVSPNQNPYYDSPFGKVRVDPAVEEYAQKLGELLRMTVSEVSLRRMESLYPLKIPDHFDDFNRIGIITTKLTNCDNVFTVAGQEFELSLGQALSFNPSLIHSSKCQPNDTSLMWQREVIILVQK